MKKVNGLKRPKYCTLFKSNKIEAVYGNDKSLDIRILKVSYILYTSHIYIYIRQIYKCIYDSSISNISKL